MHQSNRGGKENRARGNEIGEASERESRVVWGGGEEAKGHRSSGRRIRPWDDWVSAAGGGEVKSRAVTGDRQAKDIKG